MARRVRDLQHADFRQFTKGVQVIKRQLRELQPVAEPQSTLIIHSDEERRIVSAYLVAKFDDERAGGSERVTAFRRDREKMRVFRRVVARIPLPSGRAVNE